MFATLLTGWVLTSPFGTGALIARSERARRLLITWYVPGFAAGWLGLALLAASVFTLDGWAAVAATLAGGPLSGLAFWVRRGSRGDDDGPGPAPDLPPSGGERVVRRVAARRSPRGSCSHRRRHVRVAAAERRARPARR